MGENNFEEKKIVAWLRDTTVGREIVDREIEMKCLTCQQRKGVLLVYGTDPDGPGWCEVYCERGTDVFAHQKLSVEPEEELPAEHYLEMKMARRARDLFFPCKLRRIISIKLMSAKEALDAAETIRCIRELNKEAERRTK